MKDKYDFTLDMKKNDSHTMILKQIIPGSTVLEFGPGYGKMTKYMKERLHCDVCIVELDEESYLSAVEFAKKGYFGNIESMAWVEDFKNISFDFIIFADILEHLHDPEKILKAAKSLLKDNGKIIASVPNVSYVGVLAELYSNNFHYRDIGLLDKTHVHFFSYYSLCKTLEDSNMVIKTYDGTYNTIENSEFKEYSINLPSQILRFLNNKSLSSLYQFVFTAVKTEFYEENKEAINIDNRLSVSYNQVLTNFKLYFDMGNGFKEENSILLPNETKEGPFIISTLLPKNTKAVRFDPVESFGCVLRDFKIIGNRANIRHFETNGMLIQSDIAFATEDPQVIFYETENISHITITGEIDYISLDKMKVLADIFEENKAKKEEIDVYNCLVEKQKEIIMKKEKELIEKHSEQAEKENIIKEKENIIKEKENVIKEKESILEDQQKITKEKEKKIIILDADKNQITEELENYKQHYHWAIEQRDELKVQVMELNTQLTKFTKLYQDISTAKFWRITKPLRVILNLLKKSKSEKDELICSNIEFLLTNELHKEQIEAKFNKDIKFSILVPIYNTPENFLHDMIQSVQLQTYSKWELCLADGGNDEKVKSICLDYAKKDNRIKYKKLKNNLGISGNTNQCIEMATGNYLCLLDHDDILHPSALYENMKVIEEKDADFIYSDENTFSIKPEDAYNPHYKPDFSPDTLRSYNYICHFSVFKKELQEQIGFFKEEFDGSQDYDMVLRLTEKAEKISHIPKVLYYWRAHENSVALNVGIKEYTLAAAKGALKLHLERIGLKGNIMDSIVKSTYKIVYEITDTPLVSILIPNYEHIDDLKKCIDSIIEKTTYKNYEILIIENNSKSKEIFNYYNKLKENNNIKVLEWKGEFNYPAINNFGATFAKGKYLLFLNNDVEIITPSWLEEMLMYAQRNDVGAVGSMLYYPDETIQHAGVILGIGGIAGHSHKHLPRGNYGYMARATIVQNLSAVTAACMMMNKDIFEKLNGFDEKYAVAFNDVDLCMRIRQAGYLIVFTPYAEAYHHESKSRGYEDTPEKQKRFNKEISRFHEKWHDELSKVDPYYNPNLALDREDFSIK